MTARSARSRVQALRMAGCDDEAIVEIIAHVALNLFTAYVNLVLDVPVDVPRIALSGVSLSGAA
ncbi:MAG: hypothetical protein RIB84_29410 [Sneathiellaceae bacterium]